MLQGEQQNPEAEWNAQLQHLVSDLSQCPSTSDLTNPYADDGGAGNAQRRANLLLAMYLAHQRHPDLLLVGEAPGYLGARRTGVPFTSERILLEGVDPPGIFGAARGFAIATDDGRISSEQTATLVWRQAHALGIFLVGWNAVPLHPHRPNEPMSNRPPRRREIEQGLPFLQRTHDLFPGAFTVAMGNVAAQALSQLGIPHEKVRHPAQGGARLFAEGIQRIVSLLKSH